MIALRGVECDVAKQKCTALGRLIGVVHERYGVQLLLAGHEHGYQPARNRCLVDDCSDRWRAMMLYHRRIKFLPAGLSGRSRNPQCRPHGDGSDRVAQQYPYSANLRRVDTWKRGVVSGER